MENRLRFILVMFCIGSIQSLTAMVDDRMELSYSISDSLDVPELVIPEEDGSFTLTAEAGVGIGPNIKIMPEWKAYGWFTSQDRVEWEVNVNRAATYEVFLEWSVADDSAGNAFEMVTETGSIPGQVRPSGSWYTFRLTSIGQIKLEEGKQKIVFKSPNEDVKEALLDLRSLRFLPIIAYP